MRSACGQKRTAQTALLSQALGKANSGGGRQTTPETEVKTQNVHTSTCQDLLCSLTASSSPLPGLLGPAAHGAARTAG